MTLYQAIARAIFKMTVNRDSVKQMASTIKNMVFRDDELVDSALGQTAADLKIAAANFAEAKTELNKLLDRFNECTYEVKLDYSRLCHAHLVFELTSGENRRAIVEAKPDFVNGMDIKVIQVTSEELPTKHSVDFIGRLHAFVEGE